MNTTGKKASKKLQKERILEGAEWMIANPDHRFIDFQRYFMDKWDLSYKMVSIYRNKCKSKADELVDEDLLHKKKMSALALSNKIRKLEARDDKDIAVEKLLLAYRQEYNKIIGAYTTNIKLDADVNAAKPLFVINTKKKDE